MEKVNFSSEKLKNTWEHGDKYGFSWQQRNYRCSFCKREFRSAQALGGHMNVHRRERAKMRLLPSGDHHYIKPKPKPNPNPNPNPNFFPSSSSSNSTSSMFLPSSIINNYHQSCYAGDGGKMQNILLVYSQATTPPDKLFTHEVRDHHLDQFLTKGMVKKEIVRSVNGLNVDSVLRDAKDDLDLELRLGIRHS